MGSQLAGLVYLAWAPIGYVVGRWETGRTGRSNGPGLGIVSIAISMTVLPFLREREGTSLGFVIGCAAVCVFFLWYGQRRGLADANRRHRDAA